MKITKLIARSMAAVAMTALSLSASAAITTYTFGSFFTGSGPSGGASSSFATLSIDASADNKTFVFDLKVSNNLDAIFGTGAFVSALRVNTASNQDPISTTIAGGTWGVQAVKFDGSTSNTGGVAWDFIDSFCGTSSGCNKNAAGSRLTQGEEVKWTSVFANAQTPLLATPGMIMKVQGYEWNGRGASAEYTPIVTAVPEPETYAMMLAGLGLMVGIARRRQRKGWTA